MIVLAKTTEPVTTNWRTSRVLVMRNSQDQSAKVPFPQNDIELVHFLCILQDTRLIPKDRTNDNCFCFFQ